MNKDEQLKFAHNQLLKNQRDEFFRTTPGVLQPLFPTTCKCGAMVPMCGTHKGWPWKLVDGTWLCNACGRLDV